MTQTNDKPRLTRVGDEELYPNVRTKPLAYPGGWPSWSFVVSPNLSHTADDLVLPIRFEADDVKSAIVKTPIGEISLNDYLKAAGQAPLEDRAPFIAYAANRSPRTLRNKYGDGPAQIIPTIEGEFEGGDTLYSPFSRFGNFIAGMGPSKGTRMKVQFNLLAEDQIPIMNASEPNYQLATFSGAKLITGEHLDAFGYAGNTSFYASHEHLLPDGSPSPIALSAIPAEEGTRNFVDLSQEGVMALLLTELSFANHPNLDFRASSVAELVSKIRGDMDDVKLVGAAAGEGNTVLVKYIKDTMAAEHSVDLSTHGIAKVVANPDKPGLALTDMLYQR